MKVYLLKFVDAHDTWVQGVYSSRELAEEYLDKNPDWFDGYAMYFIQEVEVVEK